MNRTSTPLRSDEGFTLVELMVVVLIIAILIAIAIPTFLGVRRGAQDRAATGQLATAAKVQWIVATESGTAGRFTDDLVVLASREPSVTWDNAQPQAVHVVAGDVVSPGDNRQVLMYMQSQSTQWFGIRIVHAGVDAGTHTCLGPDVTDVDNFAACLGDSW